MATNCRNLFSSAACFLLALIPIFVALLTCTPRGLPARDSGVFLYVGQRILSGDIPYHDVWDHKGPIVYLLNAVGLAIFNGSEWGVWALQCIVILIAFYFLYRLLASHFGFVSAGIGIAVGSSALAITFERGNLTEAYTMPFQIGALCLFGALVHNSNRIHTLITWMLLGALIVSEFLIRPNNIGSGLVVLLFGILLSASCDERSSPSKGCCDLLPKTFALIVGGLLIATPIVVYLSMKGGIVDFIDSYFRYNFTYSESATLVERLQASRTGIQTTLSFSAMFLLAASFGAYLKGERNILCIRSTRALHAMIILAFFVEIVFSSLSGREYPHYYTTWVVPLCALGACGMREIINFLQSVAVSSKMLFNLLLSLCATMLLFVSFRSKVFPSIKNIPINATDQRFATAITESISLLAEKTHNKTLLVWGAEVALNFLTAIPSPSRFAYQYPLMQCGYASPSNVGELFRDIQEKLPIVIDTSHSNPRIVPIFSSREQRRAWYEKFKKINLDGSVCNLEPLYEPIAEFFSKNYKPTTITTPLWHVFVPISISADN